MCLLKMARSPSGVAIAVSANERVKKVVVSFMLRMKDYLKEKI